ncbi:hypothetical protein T484DRAFT_1790786, partial [Baffinella frigidus]
MLTTKHLRLIIIIRILILIIRIFIIILIHILTPPPPSRQVHVVSYRQARHTGKPASAASTPAKGAGEAQKGGEAGPLLAGEAALVARVRTGVEGPSLADSSDTMLILRLLRALTIVNGQWQMLYNAPPSIPPASMVSPEEFINVKLAWKLMRQLQDPLMLCTASLPPWCQQLAQGYGFLFPLECREFFTSCTAFGISRALHSMQQRVLGASNSDRPTEVPIGRIQREKIRASRARILPWEPEHSRTFQNVRIGRIQREKIRVSRARILPSAMRALELYAAHRSMLEVEYCGEARDGPRSGSNAPPEDVEYCGEAGAGLGVEYYGEAGTGLGPTLEFFTLVSQELQSSRLSLWRDASANPQSEAALEGAERIPVDDGLGAAP